MNFYKEKLLDHYKHPRYSGTLKNPDIESEIFNPSCGDQISFQAIVDNGFIKDIAFQGSGCIISQGTASILSEFSVGKTIKEILKLSKDDIIELIGIDLGPTRMRCALLPLEALRQGIERYISSKDFDVK